MKKHLTGWMGVFAIFSAIGAFASSPGEEEQFGLGGISYSKWGERQGGSVLCGCEYVPQRLQYGIGFRMGLSAYFADQKALDRGVDLVFPLDLYLPVHISKSLAVYAGGGVDMHVYGSNKDESPGSGYDGYGVTENLFAGVRCNFAISDEQSVFVFAEYCQDFGDISVKHEETVVRNDHKSVYKDKAKVDMSGSRFLVGIGFLF